MQCDCDPNCSFTSDGGCGYEGSISYCSLHHAAPALLEALEACMELAVGSSKVFVQARAAITQARGHA